VAPDAVNVADWPLQMVALLTERTGVEYTWTVRVIEVVTVPLMPVNKSVYVPGALKLTVGETAVVDGLPWIAHV
jgi:hypothetical protein